MKTKFLFIAFLISISALAQNGVNYKALIKDDNGNIVTSQNIDVKFTIIATSGPTDVYIETHTGATTDVNGILILTIGNGTTTDVFTDIDWSSDTHSLKVEIDIEQDASFIDMGTTQFMAVPYALSSGDHPWSKNESGINTLSNNVGINRENPEHTLDVRSMSQTDAAGINLSNSDKTRNLRLFSGSETFPNPSITRTPGHDLLFATFDDNTFAFDEQMRISSEGNVGVGTDSPNQKLEVDGKIKIGDDGTSPQMGTIRYNFLDNTFEGHNGSQWDKMTGENEVKPYFKAILNVDSTLNHGQSIPFNQVIYDNLNGFSQPTANSYTIQESGLYQIGVCVLSVSDLQVIYLKINDTTITGSFTPRDPQNTAIRFSTKINTIINLNEGDVISINVGALNGVSCQLITHPFALEWNYIFGYKLQ